jgi:small subunit ribosomal protein S1
MLDEKNVQPDAEASSLPKKEVGIGTPLRDSMETPIYIVKEVTEPQVGIGPGTPLNEPDAEPSDVDATTQTPEEDPWSQSGENDANAEEGENFAEELAHSFESEPETGEIIKGRVIRIDSDGVIVDIGYKSEGFLPREEFLDAAGVLAVQVGEEVEVLLERKENREGLLGLSKRKVDKRRAWNQAKAALASGKSVEGLIFSKCKGGLMVDLGGIQAFLPLSQLDLRPVKNPDEFLGRHCEFKIMKINQERGNIVLSRRNLLAEERTKIRNEVMSKLTAGRLVKGIVKNLTNYGAFVDVGGVDALLHVNDMSWSKVTNPKQIVKVGDTIEALVLSVDEATGRIALGLKQKNDDPWINIASKYPIGTLVEGLVVSLADFGAFLRLEEGVEGLLPISEMSWTKRVRHPKELLKAGDSVRVKVLALDPAAKKLTLGLRQTEQDPFLTFIETHKVGQVVDGTVKSLAAYGAFVEVAEGVSGLLHVSDMAWEQTKNPADLLKAGETVRVKVLEMHPDKKKISLGLKQLKDDPWSMAAKKYPVGTVVTVKVVRNTKFGIFVQIEPGIEGLIHVSQLDKEKNAEMKPLPEGDMVEAKVVKLNWGEHKIGLSIREFIQDQEHAEIQKYLSPQNKPTISLGEMSGISREELLKRVSGKPKSE